MQMIGHSLVVNTLNATYYAYEWVLWLPICFCGMVAVRVVCLEMIWYSVVGKHAELVDCRKKGVLVLYSIVNVMIKRGECI